MRVTYLRYEVLQERGRPCEQYLYRGFVHYISESRFPSINHSKDIAGTNKVNGCLEVKYANISMIINDNFKCLPLL